MNNYRIFVKSLRNLSLSSMNKPVVILFFIVLALASCQSSDKPENVPQVQVKTYPFYKDLFELKVDSIPQDIPMMIQKYSPFFELFGSNVIHIGFPEEQRFGTLLQQFVSDFHMRTVYNEIKKQFPNTNDIDEQLSKAFSYYKYYLPDKTIPQIYYYHGGFNQSVITTDSMIGIGLDKYLGENYPYYEKLGLPDYQRKKMRHEYIALDAMRYFLSGIFPYNSETDDVISHMIYEGKIQYLLSKFFPDTDDSLKFGFSGNQVTWCEKSERSIWQYLIDKKKLFSTDLMDIKRYTNDGPFTTTFPKESPPRAAVWLGYRIVSKYAKKHKELKLSDIMSIKDAQKIVQESEYNP